MLHSAPLALTSTALRSGQLDVHVYIDELCNRIDAFEPEIHALLPEVGRRERLHAEATVLQARYADPDTRPALYGVPVGVKDIFRVDGFPTRAGSELPEELFAGDEAACVAALRAAGALVLGKSVTTEFAYYEPGPTRNPHHVQHTPGGSSSGSAAAVAAGFCPLALGTQTIGSTIRPAAFCGIVGFKPSYGRIPIAGIIPFSISVDTIGYFTQDVAGIALVASVLCRDWQPVQPVKLPVLGVPDGPYLQQASPAGLAAFEQQLRMLEQAGYMVKQIPALRDIEAINRRHTRLIAAELAEVHVSWFARHEHLYRPRTAQLIREGQTVTEGELAEARVGRRMLRETLATLMAIYDIDLWVCPSAPDAAPEGIQTTGNSIMNLPWTYAGLPALSLPAGKNEHGLPFGLQCVGAFMTDERLVMWADMLASVLA